MKLLSKALELSINALVVKVLDDSTKRNIDKIIVEFYKELDGYTSDFKKRIIKEAIARAMGQGLSKQDAINISHIRNIISSRYDKDGHLVRTAYDIVKALSEMPKNITAKTKGVLIAWQADKDKYIDLKEAINNNNIKKTALRNYKTLETMWTDQAERDAEYKQLDEHEATQYIAQPEIENRSDVCHQLHGTVWAKKSDIPEWAKPLIHVNCKCKLVTILDVVTTATYDKTKSIAENRANGVEIVECDSKAGRYAQEMYRKGGNRKYGQGHSNFQKIVKRENGKRKCYYTYVTMREK